MSHNSPRFRTEVAARILPRYVDQLVELDEKLSKTTLFKEEMLLKRKIANLNHFTHRCLSDMAKFVTRQPRDLREDQFQLLQSFRDQQPLIPYRYKYTAPVALLLAFGWPLTRMAVARKFYPWMLLRSATASLAMIATADQMPRMVRMMQNFNKLDNRQRFTTRTIANWFAGTSFLLIANRVPFLRMPMVVLIGHRASTDYFDERPLNSNL
jgi:hypothetical protein